MRLSASSRGRVWIGTGLLLAAALTVVGLWFHPVTSGDHGGGSVPRCTPIVEWSQYDDQQDWRWSDLCYFPARRRVWMGAAGGLLLGAPGLVLLVAGWRSPRERKEPHLVERRRTRPSPD